MSQAERLQRLSELLIELFRSPLPTHFFQTLGDRAGSAVPHDYLAVCLTDPEKGSYLVHTLAGLDAGAVSPRGFSLYEGLPGRAMTAGQTQRHDDLALVRDGVHDLEGVLISAGLRATLVVPIRRGLDILGALLFASRPPITYGDDDVQIATLLAAGLSAALETSQAY
jgi:GAF domain-containing protein